MCYILIQNWVTWLFSLATFGIYGCYFLLDLFTVNGYQFVLNKTHYLIEISAVFLQILSIIFYFSSVFGCMKSNRLSYFILFISFVMITISSILECELE